MRKRSIWSSAVAVLAAFGMVGCAQPTNPVSSETVPMPPLASVECDRGRDPLFTRASETFTEDGSPYSVGDARTDDGQTIEREPLSPDFVPVLAILCVEIFSGEATFVGYGQRPFVGDLVELRTVLLQEDKPKSTADCTAVYDPQPNLWLVDADGNAVAPRWPADGCLTLTDPVPESILTDKTLGPSVR